MNVSPEAQERLKAYQYLLTTWQQKINLVSSSTLSHLWERHFADSLQLLAYLPPQKISLVDLGSGAGFPGLVLAMARPDTLDVTLVESDLRKCIFLETVSRETKTPVKVIRSRIESFTEGLPKDIITARGLAPLWRLFEYSKPFIKENTIHLFLKGKKVNEEIKEAQKKWEFSLEIFPSLTDSSGRILKVEKLKRVGPNDKNHSCC